MNYRLANASRSARGFYGLVAVGQFLTPLGVSIFRFTGPLIEMGRADMAV